MSTAPLDLGYPVGLQLVVAGACPLGSTHPIACYTCPVGHATECHYPMDCLDAHCGHYSVDGPELDPELSYQDGSRDVAEQDFDEEALHRQVRIAEGLEHQCAICGCSESNPCFGGCIWATENVCSRCLLKVETV